MVYNKKVYSIFRNTDTRRDTMINFVFGITIFLLILFLIMYSIKPYKFINGFIFDCFLFSFLSGLMLFFINHQNIVTNILVFVIGAVTVAILLFGIYVVMGYLLVNSIKMLKNEKISFANSLSLLLLIGIFIQLVIGIFFTEYATNKVVLALFSLSISIEIYLFISGVSFITISMIVLLGHHIHRAHQDYFIVLGCGLIDGDRVSPLLAGRINKAITAYNQQKEIGQSSKIVFSGGNGSDERISEAEAMQSYAVQHGVAIEDTIIENKSSNTFENMVFSKKIMDDISPNGYSCTYVTSDYHVFRAGIYAYKAGLRKARGIGSKTKGYYIPNAMIREYIALFVMNKKHNTIVIGFIFVVYVISCILFSLA